MIRGEMDAQPTPSERVAALATKQIREWYELTASLPADDPIHRTAEGMRLVLQHMADHARGIR